MALRQTKHKNKTRSAATQKNKKEQKNKINKYKQTRKYRQRKEINRGATNHKTNKTNEETIKKHISNKKTAKDCKQKRKR